MTSGGREDFFVKVSASNPALHSGVVAHVPEVSSSGGTADWRLDCCRIDFDRLHQRLDEDGKDVNFCFIRSMYSECAAMSPFEHAICLMAKSGVPKALHFSDTSWQHLSFSQGCVDFRSTLMLKSILTYCYPIRVRIKYPKKRLDSQ